MPDPITRSSANLQTGLPVGPGRLSVPDVSPSTVAMKYELGDVSADRTWNGDGLNLSVEARMRANASGDGTVENVMVRGGLEGIQAKVRLVKDGELDPHFSGFSLKDGALKGTVNDARDYLKEHPVTAVGATIGTVVVAHEIAKKAGPIKVDTGNVKLYQNGGLTASVVGEIAITGDSAWIRGQGAKAKLNYHDTGAGDFSVEAGYDRDARTRVSAGWSKTTSEGVSMYANAFYEERTKNAGVQAGLSFRF